MKSLILFLLPALIFGQNSGLKFGLTESAVLSLLESYENEINALLTDVGLHDVQLDYSPLVVSLESIRYTASIGSFQEATVYFGTQNQVLFYTQSLQISSEFSLVVTNNEVTESGTGQLLAKVSEFSCEVSILNSNGFPSLQLSEVTIEIGSVTFNSDLDPATTEMIQSAISENTENIQDLLVAYVYDQQSVINAQLLTFSKIAQVPSLGVSVDLSLTGPLQMNNNYLTIPAKGLVLANGQPVIPFTPQPLVPMQPGKEVQVQATDYFSSAILTAKWAKTFYKLTALPASIKVPLTTAGLNGLLPGLSKKYGKNQPVVLEFSQSSVWPIVNVTTAGLVALQFGVKTQVFVVGSSQQLQLAVTIDCLVNANLNFMVTNHLFNATFNAVSVVQAQVTNSTIGKINPKSVVSTLGKFFKSNLQQINAVTSKLYTPYPSLDFFTIVQQWVMANTGYTSLQADIVPI